MQAAKGSKRALKGLIKLLKKGDKNNVAEPVIIWMTEEDAKAAGPNWRQQLENIGAYDHD